MAVEKSTELLGQVTDYPCIKTGGAHRSNIGCRLSGYSGYSEFRIFAKTYPFE